jgi:coenzyme F420 hydrogenase subunit beta
MKRFDITQVVDEYLCHSCGACFASCGHNSISFVESIGGYYMPKIDYDTCTNCGLCFEVCSGDHFGTSLQKEISFDPFIGEILSSEVGRASDETIFQNSQSGGVTTALLAQLLDNNIIEVALVATMREGALPRGDYVLIRNSQELFMTQKSKYTPIPLLKVVSELKKIHKTIAVVGLSCHFHGLQNLCDTYEWLAKKDIIKIGLICDRIMTSSAIDFISLQATQEPIKKFVFRNKQKSSYPGNPTITTEDNIEYILDESVRIDMKDFFTPARCRLCFDKLNIFADVVMGDPHGLEGIDRKGGETLVLVRTQKGKESIKSAKNSNYINLRGIDMLSAVSGQRIAQKKKEWSAYMSAWQALGKKVPNYPFVFTPSQDYSNETANLLHSLSLDEYNSREKLLKEARNYYKSKQLRKALKKPLSIAKGMIKKLVQGERR